MSRLRLKRPGRLPRPPRQRLQRPPRQLRPGALAEQPPPRFCLRGRVRLRAVVPGRRAPPRKPRGGPVCGPACLCCARQGALSDFTVEAPGRGRAQGRGGTALAGREAGPGAGADRWRRGACGAACGAAGRGGGPRPRGRTWRCSSRGGASHRRRLSRWSAPPTPAPRRPAASRRVTPRERRRARLGSEAAAAPCRAPSAPAPAAATSAAPPRPPTRRAALSEKDAPCGDYGRL